MAHAQPLELDVQIKDELNAFAHSVTHTQSYSQLVFRQLEAKCIKQQGVDVVLGSLSRAFLHSTVGNFDEAERWLHNAERNNGVDAARLGRLTHAVNHGFGTTALSLLDDVYAHRGGEPLMLVAGRAAAIGAFRSIVRAVNQSQMNGEVVPMTTLYEQAKNAVAVCDQLGVGDADIAAMIDVAGELLREHHLLWEGSSPDVNVLDADHGGPSIGIVYRIDLTPKDAVQLGWTLTESIVARGLDRPGVYVDFMGTARTQLQVA